MVMMKMMKTRRMEVVFPAMKGTGGQCFCCVRCLGHQWQGAEECRLGSEEGIGIMGTASGGQCGGRICKVATVVGPKVMGWGLMLMWREEQGQQVVGEGAGIEEEGMCCSSASSSLFFTE